MKKNTKFQSFSSRISNHVIAIMLVTMAVISLLIFRTSSRGMTSISNAYLDTLLELVNEKVSTMLTAVEVSAENVVAEVRQHLEDPDEVFNTLQEEYEVNTRLAGMAVAFIPNYYPKKGKWFEPFVGYDDGEFVIAQIGSAAHDYFNMDWYRGTIEKGDARWSNPYYDNAGAKSITCTYAVPVRDERDSIVAILSADLSLEWLADLVRTINDKEAYQKVLPSVEEDGPSSYEFILGEGGQYIVHPEKNRILVDNFFDYADENNPAYQKLGENMISGKQGDVQLTIDGVESNVYYAPLKQSGWSMAIVIPHSQVTFLGKVIGSLVILLILLGLLIASIFFRRNIRKATRPLTELAQATREVAKGNFNTPLPAIEHNDEINVLRDSFGHMTHALRDYVDRLTETTAEKASFQRELNIARDIQMSMIPLTFPPFPERNDLEIFAELTPAKTVGGDLYDYFIRDEKLFFCIGDVSGKGIPASLVMSVTGTQFRAFSATEDRPDAIMRKINTAVVSRNSAMMFVTLFVGVLDLSSGLLEYCNAGHNAPILLSGKTAKPLPVDSNVAVGVVENWEFSLQNTSIKKGEGLFMYTDGLSEATNSHEQLFGEGRIFDTIAKTEDHSPRSILDSLDDAVQEYVGDAEQSDDLTMVCIQRK